MPSGDLPKTAPHPSTAYRPAERIGSVDPIPSSVAATQFFELLSEACSSVAERWFLLPVANEDTETAYRERVYCYELYHQLRRMSEADSRAGAPAYTVSGEIDKAGLNAVIKGGKHKPDLVWHVPGRRMNAAVVEVKMTKRWDKGGISKDLRTLTDFLRAPDGRHYERAALLLYGPGEATDLLSQVRDAAPVGVPELARVHVFLHSRWGRPAVNLGPIHPEAD